ncbi:MAG: serine/threonine protein kinase, partial [Planctomycetes bacterium]|nr:serine/threonine protein kinase [Planctomycetota bacterium]
MKVGAYRLAEQLGRGGNAVVYRARGPRGEDCAIKLLHREGRTVRQRFLREAQVLAELDHPAIVRLHAVGEHEGALYLAMPFYPGKSLAARIDDEGPLRPRDAAELAQRLADGLAYAHEHGVLHRDVKPDNVLLDRSGAPRLTDFGLARRTDLEETRLSKSGALLGTPGFWAPEQAGGKQGIGPWTDVYGLGATLYCMLTGLPPLSGGNLIEVMRAVNEEAVLPPSRHVPEVDAELDRICLRCMAKRPADRY